MGHRVDLSEVIDFADEFKSLSEDVKNSLSSVQQNLGEICNMDSFSGETADQAKIYFYDLHLTVLKSFEGLFADSHQILKGHIDSFQSEVDNSQPTIMDSNYLNNTEIDMEEQYDKLVTIDGALNETIRHIQDISSATIPNFQQVTDENKDSVKIISSLDEKLTSFTTEGKEDIKKVKYLIGEIKTTLDRATVSKGEMRYTNYMGNQILGGLPALRNYAQEYSRGDLFSHFSNVDQTIYQRPYFANYFPNHLSNLLNNQNSGDEKVITEKEANIGWNGEIGGYESPEIWEINLELNHYKYLQNHYGKIGDQKEVLIAKEKEQKLRDKYSHISEHLISEDSEVHAATEGPIILNDGSKFEYRIDSEGNVYFKAERGYKYYEETHKQTGLDYAQGAVSKTAVTALVGRGTGIIMNKLTPNTSTFIGGIIGGGTEVLGDFRSSMDSNIFTDIASDFIYVPKPGETRKAIFRVNDETGEIENLVIESVGYKIVDHKGWKEYK